MSYHYPKNAEEYWMIIDIYWADLYNILAMFLPSEQLSQADNLRLNKDRGITKLFNDAWWLAPDSPGIHKIPSWHVFCDLCSEAGVLYENDEEILERIDE
jgi:hypothetical protein